MNDCIFCKIIKKEIPADVIDENDKVIVFLSLENHPLVVTKAHIPNIYEMDGETGAEIMREAIKIAKIVKKVMEADGVNLVQSNESAAHQDVFHFHLHIKPRWHDDGIMLHWNPQEVGPDLRKQTSEKLKSALNLK